MIDYRSFAAAISSPQRWKRSRSTMDEAIARVESPFVLLAYGFIRARAFADAEILSRA